MALERKASEKERGDRVTIGLFSTEKEGGSFDVRLLAQKSNIAAIKKGLTDAAIKQGRKPPEIVVSVLLVPDWKREGNSYKDRTYQAVKSAFITRVNEEFKSLGATIEDFQEEGGLTPAEISYMEQLKANGSSADIIKTRAIINNQNRRHLQLDSNTKIYNYERFYRQTFGADDQRDAVFACCYASHYVSLQNKVVYTPPAPQGKFAPLLMREYLDYCSRNQNNEAEKAADTNSIFDYPYIEAASQLALVKRAHVQKADGTFKAFCPSTLEGPEYRLTREVVPVVAMSWRASSGEPDPLEELKKLGEVPVGDTTSDFGSFTYLIKKYTISLHYQSSVFGEAFNPRTKLLALSDQPTDMLILSRFLQHVHRTAPDKLAQLARVIPTTREGDELMRELFEYPEEKSAQPDGSLVAAFYDDPSAKIPLLKIPAMAAEEKQQLPAPVAGAAVAAASAADAAAGKRASSGGPEPESEKKSDLHASPDSHQFREKQPGVSGSSSEVLRFHKPIQPGHAHRKTPGSHHPVAAQKKRGKPPQ